MTKAFGNMLVRLLLVGVAYFCVSFLLFMFFSGGGHGSYAPMAIFGGFAAVPVAKGAAGWGQFVVHLTAQYALYTSCFIAAFFRKKIGAGLPGIAVFHLCGAVYALAVIRHGHLNTPALLVGSAAVSFLTTLGYFVFSIVIVVPGSLGRFSDVLLDILRRFERR